LGPQHPLDLVQRRIHRVLAREVVLELLHVPPRFAERAAVGDRRCARRGHQAADTTRSRSIRIVARNQLREIDQVFRYRRRSAPASFGVETRSSTALSVAQTISMHTLGVNAATPTP